MRTPPLRRRVATTALTVLTVALVAASTTIWIVHARTLDDHLDEIATDRLDLAAATAEDITDSRELAATLASRGLRATITDPDGTVHTADPDLPLLGRNLPRSPTGPPQSLHTVTGVLEDGRVLTVAVSRDGVDLALRRLALLAVLTTAIAIVVAAVALDALVRRDLRPLRHLAGTAGAIAAGDRQRRLTPTDPSTDLGRAAAAFDHMVDQLDQALATAHQAHESTRRLVADAAHQLRTPSASARAAVHQLLHRTVPSSPEQEQALLTASRETDRIAAMVHQLLRLATIDQHVEVARRPFDLYDLARTELDRTARRAPHLETELTADLGDHHALGDPDATTEILGNLLDNAARHANSVIHIHLAATDGHVIATVHDDGPGIPPDQSERVFERFVRLDHHGGTGLGLAIARQLAHAQQGDLTCRDGRFVLHLPRDDAEGRNAAAPASGRDGTVAATPRSQAQGRHESASPASGRNGR